MSVVRHPMIDGECPGSEKTCLTEESIETGLTMSPPVARSRKQSSSADKEKLGILHPRAMLFLILWYIFSAFTLFLNKYILATLKSDPTLLGELQFHLVAFYNF